MQTILLLVISIIPAVILLWYFNKQDKGEKEPRKLMWKVFIWGVVAAIFAVIIELNIEDLYRYLGINPIETFWLYIFLTAFVTAAFVEEAVKLWVVKTRVYNNKNFNEVMDGITYTIIASLGFATFENIFYVMDGGFGIGILRAVMSVPAHALFSGIMGFYIGKAKFAKSSGQTTKLIFIGFAYAVFYHGLFDFLLFTQTALMFLAIPLLVVMGLHLKSKIKLAYFHDHLTNREPRKLTITRIVKVIIATILILFGTASVIGSIMLTQDPTSG
ncbi:MAG: PrsW family glutamic-type intramembrane protease, partial [Nitrospirota bacterium]